MLESKTQRSLQLRQIRNNSALIYGKGSEGRAGSHSKRERKETGNGAKRIEAEQAITKRQDDGWEPGGAAVSIRF